jgi:hypothetical protein
LQATCEEGATAEADLAEKWYENVIVLITQSAQESIFNMDKTALFYNSQPNRALASEGEKCQGGKRHNDRVTVVLCCVIIKMEVKNFIL